MSYEKLFLIALGVTILCESIVVLALVRWLWRIKPAAIPTRICLGAGLLASAATLPYLWFVLPALMRAFLLRTIVGELGVVVAEALIYAMVLHLSLGRSLLVSAAANACSIAVGLVILPPH